MTAVVVFCCCAFFFFFFSFLRTRMWDTASSKAISRLPESDINVDEMRDKTLVKSRTFREYQLSLSLVVYAPRPRASFLVLAVRRSRSQAHRRKIPEGKAFQQSGLQASTWHTPGVCTCVCLETTRQLEKKKTGMCVPSRSGIAQLL